MRQPPCPRLEMSNPRLQSRTGERSLRKLLVLFSQIRYEYNYAPRLIPVDQVPLRKGSCSVFSFLAIGMLLPSTNSSTISAACFGEGGEQLHGISNNRLVPISASSPSIALVGLVSRCNM